MQAERNVGKTAVLFHARDMDMYVLELTSTLSSGNEVIPSLVSLMGLVLVRVHKRGH